AVNLAHERGFTFLGRVEVLLTPDESVPRRVAHVAGMVLANPVGQPPAPSTEVPAVERTQTLNLARIQGAMLTIPPAALTIRRDGEDSHLSFDAEVLTVGRALDNDLVVEDPSVSRHHAEIRRQCGRYYLTDLQSTNGTSLNGQRVAGSFLRDGDNIRIGDVELVFQIGRTRED
ncbi:MAG: FHA domain-containing protein, partial [Chloroflexota bacterium]